MAVRKVTVDLRSDTLTKPTPAMRKAMFEAEVGDDVLGEDPTVKELESYTCELTGKESALFLPSATMSNLVSVMSHCHIRGQEILVGDLSHIHLNEQGGIAQLAGLHHRTLRTNTNGTLSLEEAASMIRNSEDIHQPISALLCLENTHNYCGGTVLPMDYIEKAGQFCKDKRIPLHMDGSRIMNAAVYLKTPVADLLKPCDSVTICLSKGLSAPAGSVIAGSRDFIKRAIRCRKVLGGAMRQSGILAAAGLVALKDMVSRLKDDHDHASHLAKEIVSLGSSLVTINIDTVQTNMVFASIDSRIITSENFCQRLATVTDLEVEELGEEAVVKIYPVRTAKKDCVRFVFHSDISEDQLKSTVKKVCYVIREIDKNV